MSKYYWFLGVFLGLISCDVDYEDNKRLLITGTVVDEDELPVPEIPVAVFITIYTGFKGSTDREILGEGKTDTNGNFSLVTLSPIGTRIITAEINESVKVGYRPKYATYSLIGLKTVEAQNATIALRTLKLENVANSIFTIRRLNNSTDTLYYDLKANPIKKQRVLDPALSSVPFYEFFNLQDTLLPAQNETSVEIGPLLARDTLQLDYSLSGNPNTEIISQKLVYNSETDSYVFEL